MEVSKLRKPTKRQARAIEAVAAGIKNRSAVSWSDFVVCNHYRWQNYLREIPTNVWYGWLGGGEKLGFSWHTWGPFVGRPGNRVKP